jgi:glyoxylase-like metal-dependent hydrolase (beta-lactamase superfamily II)
MQILPNTGGVAMTNCFVIADEGAREAVLFDAPDHTVAPLLDEVERRDWKLIGLWLTHGHFDHLADHKLATDRFPDAKVLIHANDDPMLKDPGSRMFALPFTIAPRSADALIEDGQRLKIGALEVEVLLTPGHSPGHVAFHFPNEKVLVGGDLIIGGSVGRTDLPGADPEAFFQSLRRVASLPPDTRLLPGHGDITTIGEELETNEYLRHVLKS